jgi:hypothetical protein
MLGMSVWVKATEDPNASTPIVIDSIWGIDAEAQGS